MYLVQPQNILCNIIHDLMMIAKSNMSKIRAGLRMILKQAWNTLNAHFMSYRHPHNIVRITFLVHSNKY